MSKFLNYFAVSICFLNISMVYGDDMKEYRVTIPEEVYAVVEFKRNNLPAVATVNAALVDFEPKEVFAWHLSLTIQAAELGDNKMPTRNEQNVLYEFENRLGPSIKRNGNAIFLARITGDGWRELLYRVYNPEPLNNYLQNLIETKNHIRPFDYRIEPDESWEQANWLLNAVNSQ